MKLIFLFTVFVYQKILSSIFKNVLGVRANCRFSPSCSEYAKRVILKHGPVKGGQLSIARLLRCQPFFNF